MRKFAVAILAIGTVLSGPVAAQAQAMPSPVAREIMVKATLMTFNDANLTDNYEVFDALAAAAFAEAFPPDKLSETFATFRENEIDLSAIVAFPPIEDPAPVIDADGILKLTGYFETEPSQVTYDLGFVPDGRGNWRVIGINVNVEPPEEMDAAPDDQFRPNAEPAREAPASRH